MRPLVLDQLSNRSSKSLPVRRKAKHAKKTTTSEQKENKSKNETNEANDNNVETEKQQQQPLLLRRSSTTDDENFQDDASDNDEDDDEDEEEDDDRFTLVYRGTASACKVGKLAESCEYLFKVAAVNEAGQGHWSEPPVKFATTTAPPALTRAPTVAELTTSSCLIEWPAAKLAATPDSALDTIEYSLQMVSGGGGGGEYKEIYRGEACSMRLTALEANTEHTIRVCATRICRNSEAAIVQRLISPFSPPLTFATQRVHKSVGNTKESGESSSMASASATSRAAASRMQSSGAQNGILARLLGAVSFSSSVNLNRKINENVKPGAGLSHQGLLHSNRQQQQPATVVVGGKQRPTRASHYHNQASSSLDSKITTGLLHEDKSSFSSSLLSTSVSVAGSSARQQQRMSSDQFWAFGLIFVLLAVAFVIAYACMFFYDLSVVADVPDNEL